jgi:anaerobic magnesium-protoporphyrin IX monomethyl ester cyclase
MGRVVLFNPAHKFGGPVQPRIELPLNLLTVATPLDRAGYTVKIVDQRVQPDWREILEEELRHGLICVGISSMTGPQIRNALDVSRLVRQRGNTPVVWGGVHPTLLPEQTLAHPDIDIVVQGEGEETFAELVRALEEGTPLEQVCGIWFKQGGKIFTTGPRPAIDLNKQSPLSYHLVDLKPYLLQIGRRKHITIETSRGCNFKCRYCWETSVYHSRWRGVSAEEVLRRIKLLVKDYGIQGFLFCDDNFFVDKERAIEIFRRLKAEVPGVTISKLDGHLSVLVRLTDEELEVLHDGGCQRLMMGIESGSARILKLLNKEQDLNELLHFNRRLASFGISPHYFFMIAYPTEELEDLAKTVELFLRLSKENPAAIPRLNIFTPFPGTGLFDIAIRQGFVKPNRLEDWVSFNFRTINQNAFYLSKQRKRLLCMLHFASALALRNNFISPYKKTHWLVRLVAALYYPAARLRIRYLFYRFPLEITLAEWLRVYPRQE